MTKRELERILELATEAANLKNASVAASNKVMAPHQDTDWTPYDMIVLALHQTIVNQTLMLAYWQDQLDRKENSKLN